LGQADSIQPESLKKVRSFLPHVKIIQYNVDALFTQHNINMLRKNLPYINATFVTTAGSVLKCLSHTNGVVSFMPNPVDKSIDYPKCHERSDQAHDVFWSMRISKKDEDPRVNFPLFLEKSEKVTIDYYGMNGKPELWGADYYEAIENAKMGLNITQTSQTYVEKNSLHKNTSKEDLYLYSSDRIAHYMGSGLLILSTRSNGLKEMYAEDKEIIFFSSQEELLEKAVYFKNHDGKRREIARRGWEKCHSCYNERLVAKYIIETSFNLPLSEDYSWPTQTY
jgi:hypothetical protein